MTRAATGEEGSATQPVRPLAPLGVPQYRRLWFASVISGLGTFIQLTAAPWLMLELTGSVLMVSLVTTALLLPQLLLTLPAGALADVFDRRSILLVGSGISASAVSVMAVLAHLDLLTPELLLGLTFSLGVGNAVGQPSFQTLVPDLVPARMLTQAITLTAASFNVSRAIGPSIGGVLIAAGLTSFSFALNAFSYLGIIGVIATLPKQVGESGRLALWRSTATGLRYARVTQQLRSLLMITALFSFTSACVQALLPAFVAADLRGDATDFGTLYAAFGVGALLAALSRDRANLLFGARMLPFSVIGFATAGIALGMSTSMPVAAVALLLGGMCWVWTVTTLNASIQTLAPKWVRGRIVSLFVLSFGFQPIGAFCAGLLAERTGAGTSIAIMTGACLLLGLALLRSRLPSLSDMRSPLPGEPGWTTAPHARAVSGSPIVVISTWQVETERVTEFLALMRDLRGHRLRTGATRWALFRDSDVPGRITEMFSVPDWDEHLAQHGRLDREALDTIARARAYDRNGAPVSRHLAGVDPTDDGMLWLPASEIETHQRLHDSDGSLPLAGSDDPATP